MTAKSGTDQPATYRPLGRVAVVGAAAAIGLAACSGGHKAPQVASLPTTTTSASAQNTVTGAGSTGDGSSPTTAANNDPTRLVDEWATCMHSHGDPNQAAPTIDSYGVIHVTIPAGAESLSNEVHAGADPCNQYMAAAQAALRAANPVAPPPDNSELIKYVECMRSNGVPDYPYPTGNTTSFQGTGVDPNSPQVQNVNKLCGQKLHLPGWWVAGNGQPGEVSISNVGPNGSSSNPGQPPPCFFAKAGCPNGGFVPVSGGRGGSGSNG